MKANVGTVDRVARLIIGLALIIIPFTGGLGLFDTATYKYVAVAVGAILVATAAVRFCPLYRILGLRTCPA